MTAGWSVGSCGYNGYGVGHSSLKILQSVGVGRAAVNIHRTASSIVNPVASDTVQRIRRSPGHPDTSGTILDPCHISGGWET